MGAAKAVKPITAIGKRKTSIARIQMVPGAGKVTVNERDYLNYFGREALRCLILQPFEVTSTVGMYDVAANIYGGGTASQADALKYAISKTLLATNPDYRKPLRNYGLLTRDDRIVERKKYGRHGARKRPQYSKR